ncbi:hypothetical protein ABZP36_012799 [Zizania latifolia]
MTWVDEITHLGLTVDRHKDDGTLVKDLNMTSLPALSKFIELLELLQKNKEEDLGQVVILFQDMLDVVTRDIMEEQEQLGGYLFHTQKRKLVLTCQYCEARKRDALHRARVRGEEPPPDVLSEDRGLHTSIEGDVKDLLEGKTSAELEEMRSQIEPQMCSGIAKVVEYWEAILKRLHIYKTKACLREIHASLLRKHLHHLEHPSAAEQDVEAEEEINTKEENTMHDDEEDDKRYSPEPIAKQKKSRLDEEAGSFSPELMHVNEDEEAIDPEEDKAPVKYVRLQDATAFHGFWPGKIAHLESLRRFEQVG